MKWIIGGTGYPRFIAISPNPFVGAGQWTWMVSNSEMDLPLHDVTATITKATKSDKPEDVVASIANAQVIYLGTLLPAQRGGVATGYALSGLGDYTITVRTLVESFTQFVHIKPDYEARGL